MSYAYKRQINITGQSGAGSDYQVLLKIGETSGASGEDFDLGGYSLDFPNAKNDGGDLKFFANDETTVLPFWVEKVEGSTPNRLAYVWVKVSADLGSNQSIWVYFGDAGASNLSDGDSTFILFDDFDSGTLNTSKWQTPGSYTISSSYIKLNTTGNSLVSQNSYADYTEMRAMKSMPDTSASSVGFFGYNGSGWQIGIVNHYPGFAGNVTVVRRYNGSASDVSFGVRYNGTTVRLFRMGRYNNNYRASVDTNVLGPTSYSTITATAPVIVDSVYENGANPGVDWVFIKKFQATEPSYGSAGSITPTSDLPSVTTDSVGDIATYSATGNGTITDIGGSDVDLRGFVWSTSSHANPGDVAPASSDYDDYISESGTFSTGAFTGALDTLSPETTYYVRAWAHNDDGYSYGDEVDFATLAIPYAISGTVKLNGVGVEGAVVRCIHQASNTALPEQDTNADGEYIFTDLEGDQLYHLSVEYVDGEQLYNALSYWDILPYEVT